MKYVIGIDLGTSAVKALMLNQNGKVCLEISKSYPLIQDKSGYSEQNPEEWIEKTVLCLKEIVENFTGNVEDIEGISFSGQMHGLVLLDKEKEILRNAILWNDTRTTKQCNEIYDVVGREQIVKITKNPALEGFTLPKLLWVKENEPDIFALVRHFLLPKDYLRYRMTDKINCEYSDAAGTLLLDINNKCWSSEVCKLLGINKDICPPLVKSEEFVGIINSSMALKTGLSLSTKVFAGGADNACGAIGAGILSEGKTLCSVGTSGVILTYEQNGKKDFDGKVHYFNHAANDAYYTMGVTLAAGYSLNWFKERFAENESFESMLARIDDVPVGSNGLIFTPYLVGERTPHADSVIRGSFIGMDSKHNKIDFIRAIVEGISFSLCESIQIFRDNGKEIDTIISIGGGAKSDSWLQIQADIFNAKVVMLGSEQGPGLGSAMLAACGSGWFESLQECANTFIHYKKEFTPNEENAKKYSKLFKIYQEVYSQTKRINTSLQEFRN